MTTKLIDPRTLTGQQVRIYRNLHNGLLSVQTKTSKGWKVQGHLTDISLRNVHYCVSKSGRERVLRTKSKNVHAFIIGEVLPFLPDNNLAAQWGVESVTYNPYKSDSFHYASGKTIEYSYYCLIQSCKPSAAY